MQRAQRTFGRFLKRAPNEADVESMLTDFTDSEQMLEKVRESTPTEAAAMRVVAQARTGGVSRAQQFPAHALLPTRTSPHKCTTSWGTPM
jgi:hypothetical protein